MSAPGTGTRVERADITDEGSVAELASAVGGVDHIVSTASARAQGGPVRRALRQQPRAPRRTPQDIATVAVMALTSSFLTGVTIPVDGGEHLV